jgi:hypothetical protein
MSKVNLVADTTPSIMLLNAVCKRFPKDDWTDKINLKVGEQHVEVKLTLNGVEIPFEATVNEMWTQVNNDLDKRALELVKQAIDGTDLQNLFDTIKRAEYEIEEAIKTSLAKLKGQ